MSSDRFVSRHCLLVGVLPCMLCFLLGGSDLHCTMTQTFWPVQNYQAQTHDSKDLTLSHFWMRNTHEVLESSISANLAKPSKQSRVKKYAVWLMSIKNVIISVVSVVNDVIHNKKNEIWAKKSLKFSRDLIIMTLLTTLVTLVHEKILFQTIPVYTFAKNYDENWENFVGQKGMKRIWPATFPVEQLWQLWSNEQWTLPFHRIWSVLSFYVYC